MGYSDSLLISIFLIILILDLFTRNHYTRMSLKKRVIKGR